MKNRASEYALSPTLKLRLAPSEEVVLVHAYNSTVKEAGTLVQVSIKCVCGSIMFYERGDVH